MKILVVTQYFWPEDFRINDLCLGLRERGHDVEVLTGKPNYPQGSFFKGYSLFGRRKDNFQGIPVKRVPMLARGRGGGGRLALNYLSFALSASLLGPFFCRGPADAVFVFEPSPITVGFPAIVLRWLKSAPLVFWMQDLWPESLSATGAVRSKTALALVALMVRFIYKGCNRILVQSLAFIPSVRRLGGRPEQIAYFPNSAEALYRPVQVPQEAPERRLLPKGFIVTFAGNIGAAQDFETILDAAEIIRQNGDIRLVILGSGRMSDWVARQVRLRHLENTVIMMGRYPVASMPCFFALSDVLLVTLKKDPIFAMTIPSKVQSYMACGRPIIAALDGEGARVVTEAGAGMACPAENPAALAKTIEALYHTPENVLAAMGENGRRYFHAHFERERLIGQLDEWLKDARELFHRRNA